MRRRRIALIVGALALAVTPASAVEKAALSVSIRMDCGLPRSESVLANVRADLQKTPSRRGVVAGCSETPNPPAENALATLSILGPSDPSADSLADRSPHASRDGRPVLCLDGRSPAWLVHAVLRAANIVNVPVSTTSWPRQVAHRALGTTCHASQGGLLINGYGAQSTTADWSTLLAATARRIDSLEGAPRTERRYLVIANRVWIARDLYWIGLVLWVLLLWRDRPGTWRQQKSEARRRTGREFLPGALFRWLFLAAYLAAPAVAAPLTYPAAALLLFARRVKTRWGTILLLAAGLLPTGIVLMAAPGALAGGPGNPPMVSGLLLAAVLAVFTVRCLALTSEAPATGTQLANTASQRSR